MEVYSPNNNRWYLKLVPVTLVLLTASFYFETIKALYVRWIRWDESLSHGLIIIGLYLYFLFLRSPLNTSPNSLFARAFCLAALGLSSIAWYLANLINVYIIEQLFLLIIINCLLASVFGIAILKRHFKLLLLPVFAIPIWDQLTDPLVNMSSFIVGEMVRLIRLPAVIDSNSIFIPYGEIIIADGCSGLRYLTISLAIAYIISYLNDYSLKKLIISLIVATFLGLAANWLRIFILVIVGYETQMQSSLMSDHEYFGWALFALILFPAIYFAPVVRQPIKKREHENVQPQLVAPLMVLALGPLLNLFLTAIPEDAALDNKIPHDYTPVLESRMPMRVQGVSANKTETAVTADEIYIQINQFQRKNPDEKLVPYLPRLYDHAAWSLTEERQLSDNGSFKVKIFRNKHSGTIVAQAQWFDVGGMATTNYAIAKLLQVPAVIKGKNNFTIFILQSTCKESTCAEEINRITRTRAALIMNPNQNSGS